MRQNEKGAYEVLNDFSGGYDEDDMLAGEEYCEDFFVDDFEIPKNVTELLREQFVVFEDQCLGSGAHGKVYRGVYNNQFIAVKRISTLSIEQLRREVSVLAKYRNSPFIIGVIGVCKATRELVLSFKENGSLQSYLKKQQLTFSQKKQIVMEILNGLISLHDDGRVHGDISTGNILIDGEGHACLCDFNLSKLSNESSMFGNLVYSAPENYDPYALYTTKSDIFSFGLVLYEVFFPPSPLIHLHHSFHHKKEKISRDFWCNPTNPVGIRDLLSFPEVNGEEAVMKSIILCCLEMCPSVRPRIQEIAHWIATNQFPI